jgi:high-affinity iron transporter
MFPIVLLMNTLIFQMTSAGDLIIGALLGIAVAAVIAVWWSIYGHRVNLSRFVQVTAVFLMVFVVQLVVYGFHELTEANIGIPNSEAPHWATEPYGPDGMYGQFLTYLLVALPLGWLLIANLLARRQASAQYSSAR